MNGFDDVMVTTFKAGLAVIVEEKKLADNRIAVEMADLARRYQDAGVTDVVCDLHDAAIAMMLAPDFEIACHFLGVALD